MNIAARNVVVLRRSTDPLARIFGALSGYYPISTSYCFQDVAGTVPCSADGQLIKCVKPRYGGLPNLTQAGLDSLCPLFKDDGGGRWRADFDGVDDELFSTSTLTIDAENLLAIAMTRATNATSSLLTVQTATTNYHRISSLSTLQRINGGARNVAGSQYLTAVGTNADPLNANVVKSSLLTAATVDIASDQTQVQSVSAVGFVPITSAAIRVGSIGTTMSTWGFAVHRASAISAADRATIVTALGSLQGRTI